jgi:hypothetical protein
LFREIEQCEIFMTEIDASRKKGCVAARKGALPRRERGLFALQQRALDSQSAVSNEGVGSPRVFADGGDMARHEEKSSIHPRATSAIL